MVDKQQYHGLVRRDVFSIMPERPGRILDVGGGYGATSAAIKNELGAESAVVVDLFADKEGVHPDVDSFEKGDVTNSEFRAALKERHGSFDTILCLDVLEHIEDPWSAVDALTDLLSDGGSIVASLPNVNHVSVFWPLLFKGEWTLRDAGILDRTHLRFFVKNTAIELMTSSGLAVQAFGRNRSAWRIKRFRIPHFSLFGLGDRFVTVQYLIRVG